MTGYRVLTFGPWDCDGPDSGDPIYLDGSRFNGTFFPGNPTVDGLSPESKKKKHHRYSLMQDATESTLVKARP